MKSKAEQFFDDIRGKKVAMLGIGVSHSELIKMLAQRGAVVTACDKREKTQLGGIAGELEKLGVTLKLGESYLDGIDADIIFRTPGMRFHLPELEQYRRGGVVVTSEMEVFFDLCPCKIIAVTGSDGKTTTTTLIAEMLRAQGKTVHLGGNIGRALMPQVLNMRRRDFAVVELSSFQLISMRTSPHVAVITNITPNHLDMHDGMWEYINAKKNVFIHQNAFSRTVLCLDNEITAGFQTEVRGECMLFSLERRVENGAYFDTDGIYPNGDGALCLMNHGELNKIMNVSDIRLPGRHNIANYLAAVCAVSGYVKPAAMRRVAREFGGVEHRIEFVRELNGVKWYNDSIATTPTRAIAGLRSFERKLILIAGGYDKNIPYGPLAPEIIKSVKLLILTGPTAEKIESAVREHAQYAEGAPAIVRANDLPGAVHLAKRAAQNGDIVSLSPASASFDAYANFEARGRHFKELVNAL